MVASRAAIMFNATPISLSDIPLLDAYEFRTEIAARLDAGARLLNLFARAQGAGYSRLFAIVGSPHLGELAVCSMMVGEYYESLTPSIPQANGFEREIAEQSGILPIGHPQWQSLRLQSVIRKRTNVSQYETIDCETSQGKNPVQWELPDWINTATNQDALTVERAPGETVVEIGPLQAGIQGSVEYRFHYTGDTVNGLELQLGRHHRGLEQSMCGGPDHRTLSRIESVAGDSVVGQTLAYGQAIEALSFTQIPLRAHLIRAIALELERVARHTDVIRLMTDVVGSILNASVCGRLFNSIQEVTAFICGNRLGKSLIRPGGVGFDLDPAQIDEIASRVATIESELSVHLALLWKTPSVQSRFEGCGRLSAESCREMGVVGPIHRASGHAIDARHDFPAGIYRYHQIPVSTVQSGDVFARGFIRWLEIKRSLEFIRQELDFLRVLKPGPIRTRIGSLKSSSFTVSLVEGAQGEICHTGITDDHGKLAQYRICDPAFHNWPALAVAMQGQQLTDFNLIQSSFASSIAGYDR